MTMAEIFRSIAICNGVTVEDLRSPIRERHIAWPRQYGMLLCRRAGFTYTQIARYLRRDHRTVMHGVKAAQKRESEK